MTKLTEVQVKLAEQLLLRVKDKEMYVEYNELAARIDPPIHWRQVGKNIGEVSKSLHRPSTCLRLFTFSQQLTPRRSVFYSNAAPDQNCCHLISYFTYDNIGI